MLQIEGWARSGLTDEQISHNMGIHPATFYRWQSDHKELCEAIKRGKAPVDIQVENALLKRALGFECEEVTTSSIVMYLIANMADIAVFDKLKEMTGGKWLWMRNNTATILCNCLENFGFIFLAFLGVYSAAQCAEIAIATSVIEIVAAVCDTPFAYIGRKIEPVNRG